MDEIVIFEDGQSDTTQSHNSSHLKHDSENGSYNGLSDPNYFLMHLLSYLETPPHLRTHLFPLHPDLRTAGTLPSLDMPHHLRAHEWCQYREGVTVEPSTINDPNLSEDQGKKKKRRKPETDLPSSLSTEVFAGLKQSVSISTPIAPKTRVTLKFSSASAAFTDSAGLSAEAVSPSAPREEAGYYWGYSTRPASSLSSVFTESPFEGGYDLTVGTSERGASLSSLTAPATEEPLFPDFKHILIVFGGISGLEAAVKADKELTSMGVTEPEKLFDRWVNLCPGQGSRTIRTEEALWLGLMGLRNVVLKYGVK